MATQKYNKSEIMKDAWSYSDFTENFLGLLASAFYSMG